jgi:lipopolysaccharide/colanic/teichoic acid biosynthesis glycosyltransferase
MGSSLLQSRAPNFSGLLPRLDTDSQTLKSGSAIVSQAFVWHPSVSSTAKRGLDILGACLGLLVTAVIFLPLAIAIYLDNPGPILYSQLRCGYRGKSFRIWKFRSMVQNADHLKHQVKNQANGLIFKNDHDPRITRVGRLLRSTSLDEFPQFWNVLRGEMSLVGTRPPTLDEVQHYNRRHWQRLNVKPGLTGEWQANGRSSVLDFEEIVTLDLRYQQRWSVRYDLILIWKTIQSVILRKGAY